MRFIADGPSIPDELLTARDEGRVVFFCGAGVSRARANLTDFLGLARTVADKLAVTPESAVRQLIGAIEAFPSIAGVGSPVSADRVFSLIERDFRLKDINKAIAAALRPTDSVDLSAHRQLLDLAKAPDGSVRLITTNFDLLFEACQSDLQRWKPPRLPDPLRSDEFRGIVHLHGHVTDDYSDAAGDGFVISSAEFGQAYLSERWATDFIRAVLEKFLVVFVGYAADDPPMQYLLEALHRTAGSLTGVYAFQSGTVEDAQGRWLQKGVQPIAYGASDDHGALWQTLSAWAERARNPDRWYEQTIALAQSGPETLLPHQRGQVAHIVSTVEGARRFSRAAECPPASWLYSFDPLIRFSEPGYARSLLERGDYFDPFDAYGIDSDPVPAKPDPNDSFSKRDLPEGVWDFFALTRQDRQNLRADQYPALRGHWSSNTPRMLARLDLIGDWLTKVAVQPAAVWWAAKQSGLHPDIQGQIRFAIEGKLADVPPVVRKAWHYIFDAWASRADELQRDWFEFTAHVKIDGWSEPIIRQLGNLHKPYLKVDAAFRGVARASEIHVDPKLYELVNLDVEYPSYQENLSIPDEHLPQFLRHLRRNLELGVALETEIGGYGLDNIVPIEREARDSSEGNHLSGISQAVVAYVELFKKLVNANRGLARVEATAWQHNKDAVFTLLKIWGCGDARLFAPSEVTSIFRSLSRKEFWHGRYQRDLLIALSKRWKDLSVTARRNLERRLLQGRLRWQGEKRADYLQRRAALTLDRIHWLASKRCRFAFDLKRETKRLKSIVPAWESKSAAHAADSMESRAGWVRTDTDSAALSMAPLATLLGKAQELSGRSDEFFVQREPFSGLVADKPVRAFAALRLAANKGDYPDWAWRAFLGSDARKNDRLRFVSLIACRLACMPRSTLTSLLRSVADWLLKVSGLLLRSRRDLFDRVWEALLDVLRTDQQSGASAVSQRREGRDWATEALNAPTGSMAQALMNDPDVASRKAGDLLPNWWVDRADQLLSLPEDLRRHALPLLTHNLAWFFAVDCKWTEEKLLYFAEQNNEDSSAFWAGFFWAAKAPQESLFLRIKPALLRLIKGHGWTRRQHAEILGGIVLLGWAKRSKSTGERVISNDEMRYALLAADDEFRAQIIWQIRRWSPDKNSPWYEDGLTFLREVWPRQIVANSPRVTARFVELVFAHDEKFADYVDCVLPFVIKVDGAEVGFPVLSDRQVGAVDKFPEKALALLTLVLPEDTRRWPYGIDEILTHIGNAASDLRADNRYIELTRKWNAR